jgi:negative regulator of sigma-B (phosphoserine phosphatase)
MSLATFDVVHNLLTWLAIGNVAGVLRRASLPSQGVEEPLLLRAGVVGIQLPPLQASILSVVPGDTLILATDGIQSGFDTESALDASPQGVAEAILKDHSKGNDDALVAVARYMGQQM